MAPCIAAVKASRSNSVSSTASPTIWSHFSFRHPSCAPKELKGASSRTILTICTHIKPIITSLNPLNPLNSLASLRWNILSQRKRSKTRRSMQTD